MSLRLKFLVSLSFVVLLLRPADPCSPGRGYARRRAGLRLRPLVLHQHVPNTPETSLAASGPPEGRVERGTDRYHRLVVNDNTDVLYKNEDGNGQDLIMTVVYCLLTYLIKQTNNFCHFKQTCLVILP